MIRKKVKKKCLTDRSYPQRRYHPLNSKDRVSREITGTFVKCKIRNASPRKWNKPRRAGVARGNGGGGGSGDGGGGGGAAAAATEKGCKGRGESPTCTFMCLIYQHRYYYGSTRPELGILHTYGHLYLRDII